MVGGPAPATNAPRSFCGVVPGIIPRLMSALIQWHATPDLYAWRFPAAEIDNGAQLIVAESQEAVLVTGGAMEGPFKTGRHVIDTEKVPLLGRLFGKSPRVPVEVWFVNRMITLDVKWGTADPIQLQDPRFGIMVPVRAFGQLGVQIDHSRKFLVKLVGTLTAFDRARLVSYFRGVVLTAVKDLIAQKVAGGGVSFLELSAKLQEISQALRQGLETEFGEYGLRLMAFHVNSINVPEDDPAVARLKSALVARAERQILGGDATPGKAPPVQIVCDKCGTTAQRGARFCPACGDPFRLCPSCGTDNPQDRGQCRSCGAPLTVACQSCGAEMPPGSRFCSACGKPPTGACASCGAALLPGAKFCPGCGKPAGGARG